MPTLFPLSIPEVVDGIRPILNESCVIRQGNTDFGGAPVDTITSIVNGDTSTTEAGATENAVSKIADVGNPENTAVAASASDDVLAPLTDDAAEVIVNAARINVQKFIGEPGGPAPIVALDLGSCSEPIIQFAVGLDGRPEAAFAPNNQEDFEHGSEQNIGIIVSFICGRLRHVCKAPADTVHTCNEARTVAQAVAQDHTAADIFNDALAGGRLVAMPMDD